MTENPIAKTLGELQRGDTFTYKGDTYLVSSSVGLSTEGVNTNPSSLDCGGVFRLPRHFKVKHSYYVTWGMNDIVRRHYDVEDRP